jgi:hypothetical protein
MKPMSRACRELPGDQAAVHGMVTLGKEQARVEIEHPQGNIDHVVTSGGSTVNARRLIECGADALPACRPRPHLDPQ